MSNLRGKAVGGAARAKSLSPERRREIALAGVQAKRERATLVPITHQGDLKLSGFDLPCYVTSSGERLLSGRGLQEALRLVDEEAPASGQKPGSRVDRFLSSKWANPLIYKDKGPDHFLPIRCVYEGKAISGYRAEVLADVCEAMLEARDLGLLTTPRRLAIAKQCEILMRGFMRVGIIALVDEATGYQKDRVRDELAQILQAFVAKEMQPYLKKFPAQFYQELFRLRNLPFDPKSVKRPLYFGHLTNDIIYRRLAPGVWLELKQKSKKEVLDSQAIKPHLHRFLTGDIGDPKLKTLITKVTTIMQLSISWPDFKQKLDQLLPAYNESMSLPFELESDSGEGF
jgi:P63C domain